MPKKPTTALSLNFLSIAAILAAAPLTASSPASAAAYTFTQIDVPGATFTVAFGINDAAQIVGTFFSSTGGHGFLATPATSVPEPATLTLLCIGLTLTGLCMMRRRAISPKPH